MLDNPDAQTETFPDYVWADSWNEAQRKCQALADQYTKDGGSVVRVRQVVKVGRGKKYECQFEGEVS